MGADVRRLHQHQRQSLAWRNCIWTIEGQRITISHTDDLRLMLVCIVSRNVHAPAFVGPPLLRMGLTELPLHCLPAITGNNFRASKSSKSNCTNSSIVQHPAAPVPCPVAGAGAGKGSQLGSSPYRYDTGCHVLPILV